MEKANNETEELIESLAGELEPMKCLKHPCIRALYWFLFSGIYVLFVVFYLGVRPDFSVKLTDPVYLFEIFLAFAMSMSAVMSSHWMCVPDMRGQGWMPVVSLTLFTVFLGWLLTQIIMEGEIMNHMHFSHCMVDSIVFGMVPAVVIVFLSMKGHTTRPYLMIFMNSVAVAGLGYIALRMTCGCDICAHVVIHHVSPYVLLGAVIAAVGQRLYRW